MEGCEGYTEINGIIFNGGLNGVGLEDRVLIAPSQCIGWGMLWRSVAHYSKDPKQKSGHLLRQTNRKTSDVRPHLTALLWDNGEAQLLIVELEPDIFAQRRERGG